MTSESQPDRQAAYDELRERFLTEPSFRSEFLADPAATMERSLGSLTDDERAWIASISGVSGDDLAEQLRGGVGAW
jgi:hypothetical protein